MQNVLLICFQVVRNNPVILAFLEVFLFFTLPPFFPLWALFALILISVQSKLLKPLPPDFDRVSLERKEAEWVEGKEVADH